MRRWHRWASVFFGVFLLWISVTGVLSQVGSLVNNGGFEKEEPEAKVVPPARSGQNEFRHEGEELTGTQMHEAMKAPAAAFVCPADMTCRPKPPQDPRRWNVGFLHHLHSGEEFGPLGVVISILSGLALVFFSFSGLWMYIRMWSHRRDKAHKPAWFWK